MPGKGWFEAINSGGLKLCDERKKINVFHSGYVCGLIKARKVMISPEQLKDLLKRGEALWRHL